MSRRNSTARPGSFNRSRTLRVEPLEERRLLTLTAELVKDIHPTGSSDPQSFAGNPDGLALFSADDGSSGRELWRTDGTAAGTSLVKNIRNGALGSNPFEIKFSHDRYYFLAGAGQVWTSDGTSAGTTRLVSWAGQLGRNSFLEWNGYTYFWENFQDGTGYGAYLFRTDGTSLEGSRFLRNPDILDNGALFTTDERLYFTLDNNLWWYDDVANQPHFVPPTGLMKGLLSRDPVILDNSIYVPFCDDAAGCELWKTDGTPVGTGRVTDIQLGPNSFFPSNFTQVADEFYFIVPGPPSMLWKSDGSESGTLLVHSASAGDASGPSRLTPVNDQLFFWQASGRELWTSNVAGDGTTLVATVEPGLTRNDFADLSVVNGRVFFPANDGVHGDELWVSDGTAIGTHMLTDINAGSAGSGANKFTAVGNYLFFSANDGAHGTELWVSDGTTAGTYMVTDINPGAPSSAVNWLTAVGNTLYFSADDGVHGRELWKVVVEDEAVPGDTNGDGAVDIEDLNNVRNYFGATGDGALGDTAPFDGVVDIQDLNAVRNNFGATAPAAACSVFKSAVDVAPVRLSIPATTWRHALDAVFGMWANSWSTKPTTSRHKSW